MSKTIINSIAEANQWLAAHGESRRVFKTLKSAQLVVAQTEDRIAGKTAPQSPVAPAAAKPANAREGLLAAIEAESRPGAKADLYEKLSQSLLADIKQESDPVKKTELTRAYQRSEKNRGYCLHAEATLDPKAAKTRRIMSMID